MTSKTSPAPHSFGPHPATQLATDNRAAESPDSFEHVLAELMFELAVRDMSRRHDSRRLRPRMR